MRLFSLASPAFAGVSLSFLLMVASSDQALAVTRPIDSTYKLVFEDDFSAAAVDTTKWSTNWWGCATCVTPPLQPSNEIAALDPKHVTVSDGSAHLNLSADPITVNGVYYPDRSGIIHSSGKASFTFGYFEASIYLPPNTLNGMIANWPAFITDGKSWPYDGENDILEGLGPTQGVACYHYHSAAGVSGGCSKQNMSGWHTYGALWVPGKITYYYDGVLVGTIVSNIQSSPMYMILVYGASRIHGGPVAVPATMSIDYVRVWQKY